MKALFLTKEFPPHVYGGAGVHVDYLSREIAKLMPLEVRCFGEQHFRKHNLKVTGHHPHTQRNEKADPRFQGLFETLDHCISFAHTPVDADIVHCHTWYTHYAGLLCKQLYGSKLVVTTHSLEPLRPWKREQLGNGYDVSSRIEKDTIENADLIIAVSEETKHDVLEHFNVDEDKIEVIYNGIDLQEYQLTRDDEFLRSQGIDPEKPIVLFVGRITRQKGIIHLVNAIKLINKDAQIVLCAGAPDTPEIAAEMKTAVEAVQAKRDGVIWISEMLPKEKIINLYSSADIFCCPSIYEPFGIINLEAMACETAVVASAVGGIKEVVLPGETGLLIPLEQQQEAPFEPVHPENFSADLAAAVNRLLNKPQLRQAMAKAGRKRVEETFSWEAIANQTAQAYKKLLS